MANPNSPFQIQAKKSKGLKKSNLKDSKENRVYEVIPTTVANRMVRRILFTTGIPAALGISIFVFSYILVTREIAEIPPNLTLLMSSFCFLLAFLGLTYGIVSTSWGKRPGTLLGFEQVLGNINRLRGVE
uniref:DUF3464 family protein n=1 Tax=Paulinella longichromatophora TaxID=1708747 RepID=A0A2H4ZNL6_9EUKA|nr:hypothetical protein PLO_100 [Paulinella longichromatophora]